MIIQLEDNKGGFELDVPMSLKETNLNDYHEFRAVLSRLPEEIEKDAELDIDLASIIIEAVSKMVKGDIQRIPYHGTFSVFDEISVQGLHEHLVRLINEYKPKDLESVILPIDGKECELSVQQAAFGINTLTTGEYLTFREYSNRISGEMAKGDVDGNFAFTLDAVMLAILLRKKDEELPVNKRERERFIENRSNQFGKIPLDAYLDVAFFLSNSIGNLLRNLRTTTSSTRGRGQSVRIRGKRTRKPKGSQKRRGK